MPNFDIAGERLVIMLYTIGRFFVVVSIPLKPLTEAIR